MRSDRSRFVAPSVRSLREQVMEELRAAIVRGRVHPGDRLVEAELAAELNVSRGCVREALRGLEKEGFVVSTPYRETRVASTSEAEALEVLLPVRVIIETFVVRSLAGKLTSEQTQSLARVVIAMRAAAATDDRIHLTELDIEFHRQILSFAGDPAIHAVWAGIDARARARFLVDTIGAGDALEVALRHEQYLSALTSGPIDTIGREVVHHIYAGLPERLVRTGPPPAMRALVDWLEEHRTSGDSAAPASARTS